MDGCGHFDLALFEDGELRGATADIDIQDAFFAVLRCRRGARPECRQHAFHMMTGRGADEIAALLRDRRRNRLGILPAQCFAGQDDGARIDIVRAEPRRFIGIVENLSELYIRYAGFAFIGRQRNRRLEKCFAFDHKVTARHVFRHPAQVQARKDHLGAGRADIDADTVQPDVIGNPERVFLERAVEILVVVVIRVRAVFVKKHVAVFVVFQGMSGRRSFWRRAFSVNGGGHFLFLVVALAHWPSHKSAYDDLTTPARRNIGGRRRTGFEPSLQTATQS